MPRNTNVWNSFYPDEDDYQTHDPYNFNFNQQGPSPFGGLNRSRFQFEAPEPEYSTPELPSRNRGIQPIGMQPPVYDEGPGNRYSQYLGAEPNRDDFKQSGLQRILTAAGAGLEGYRSGLPAAMKYSEAMKELPYQKAYQGWQNRGAKVAKDVELENARFRNASTTYNQDVDNRRQQQQADTQQARLELAKENFERLMDKDANDRKTAGWKAMPGPNGKVVMYHMGPNGYEEFETNNPNTKLTALEQITEEQAQQRAQDIRQQRSIQASDTRAALGRGQDERHFQTTQERLAEERRAKDYEFGVEQANKTVARTPRPRSQADTVYQQFPELYNMPGLIQTDGNSIATPPTDDEAKLAIITNVRGNKVEAERLWKEYQKMKTAISVYKERSR